MIPKTLQSRAVALLEFTSRTKPRPDWHEPNEQGIRAIVVGNHLDNAMGNRVDKQALDGGFQEFVVILKHPERGEFKINLASLLAIACGGAETDLGKYIEGPPHLEDPAWNTDPLIGN